MIGYIRAAPQQRRKTSFNIHYIFGGLCVYPHGLPLYEETDLCLDTSLFPQICRETHPHTLPCNMNEHSPDFITQK